MLALEFLRCRSLFHSIHDTDECSDESTASTIWSSVEISLGIICACLPTIQPVLYLFSRKVRRATAQQRTRRESSGVWYSESGSRQTEGRNRDGIYGRLDEELATLPPACAKSKWASERYGLRYGTQEIEDRENVPPPTLGVNEDTPSDWGIAI